MPRSPLIRPLQRAYRQLREAAATGVPVEEIAARDAAAPTRRGFLKLTAGAIGGAALTACGGTSAPAQTGGSVVIVGGGMAGLHCAYRLKQLGVTAFIYDGATRLGGRMFTDHSTFPDGQHCELGGELIDTDHVTMHALAAELGVELLDYNKDDPSLSGLVGYVGGARLTHQQLLDGFAPIAASISAALATLTDSSLVPNYKNPNGGASLDNLSIKGWLDRVGASGPVRAVLEAAYVGEFGLELEVSSALNLLELISTDTTNFQIFGKSDERFHTKTGNDTYITKLQAALNPSQLELGATLQAIRRNAGGGYLLTFGRDGNTPFVVKTDHVVLALPFTLLRKVDITGIEMPPVKVKAINELGYGTNAKLMYGFSSAPWRAQGSNGSTFTDLRFQSTWETSRLQPGSHRIITNFTGGLQGLYVGQGTPQTQAAEFLPQLDQVFPGAKAAATGTVVRFHWPTYPLTLGSYSAYRVGQYTSISGAEIERVGNLHFCGEHTSLDAQGYMEGAALTGAMAAREVAADLGIGVDMMMLGLAAPARSVLARAGLARSHGSWKAAIRRRRRATVPG